MEQINSLRNFHFSSKTGNNIVLIFLEIKKLNERPSNLHLILRKNTLNNYFDSKRKITSIKIESDNNNNNNNNKVKLKESDLNIPCQFEIELNKYYSNVIML
jgi:hypothetical protein